MANEMMNKLTIIGDDIEVKKVFGFIKIDNDSIDFNEITSTDENYRALFAYMVHIVGDNQINFITKDCGPHLAIMELSQKFPTVKFELTYSDSDTIVENFITYKFKNGEEIYFEEYKKLDSEEINRLTK